MIKVTKVSFFAELILSPFKCEMAINTTDGDGESNLGFFYRTNIKKAVLQMKYCALQLQESIETMNSHS